jgi:hypothetical protein
MHHQLMETKMTMLPQVAPPVGHYRSYLVRFWQSKEEGCWRASAQCVQTGGTLLFGDVAGLLAFFQNEHGSQPEEEAGVAPSRDTHRPPTQNG